jgi:hypothetical protein
MNAAPHIAQALKRLTKLEEHSRAEMAAIRELLSHDSGQPADDQAAPRVDENRRVLEYRGKTVPLTGQASRLASLLLEHAGEEHDFLTIDGRVRPGSAGSCKADAIRKMIDRLRRALRVNGLVELAMAIRAGHYESYTWLPVWRTEPSENVMRGHRRCRTPATTLMIRSAGSARGQRKW